MKALHNAGEATVSLMLFKILTSHSRGVLAGFIKEVLSNKRENL